jgi:hypothetical protein
MYMGAVREIIPWLHRPFPDVVADVQRAFEQGKTHIVFNNWAETLNGDWIGYSHRLSNRFPHIPADRFIYLTSGIDAVKDYDVYVEKFNIKRPLKILSAHLWEKHVRDQIKNFTGENIYRQPKYYEFGAKEKLCLFMNRVPRPHRIELLAHMFDNNLVSRSYVSFAGNFDSGPWNLKSWNYHVDPALYSILQKNASKLPLVLNMKNSTDNPIFLKFDDVNYFDTSYFSLVTETLWQQRKFYGNWEEFPGHFFSEKIFKPILMKHPFIMVSRPGSLARLRSLGYRSFSPYINETYDTIDDSKARLEAIFDEVKRLSKFTEHDWLVWQKNIRDIVEHNYITLLFRSRSHDHEDLVEYLGLR